MVERKDVTGVRFAIATPDLAHTVLWVGAVEKWAVRLGGNYEHEITKQKGAAVQYCLAEGELTFGIGRRAKTST